MRTSDYYDLNLVEGDDLVNPLIQDVPNFEKIDEQMYLNSIASVGQAVELKSGTVHALTRENPDGAMFRFVATSRFDRGDTFTVDGIQVTGLTSDGKTLADGAYVINSNVLCCLTGTVLTLYVGTGEVGTAENSLKLGGESPEFYGKASDVETALNTANAAGLLANTASEKADDAKSKVDTLENSQNWELIGSTTSTTEVTLPLDETKYHELLIAVTQGTDWALTSNTYPIALYKTQTKLVADKDNISHGLVRRINASSVGIQRNAAGTYGDTIMLYGR